jgi:Secretion system C-terminal sorting domain/Cytochrome c554 and c-prime
MKKFFLFLILVTLVGFSTGLAQTLTVEPFGVSPRDAEEDTVLQYFDRPYNGLLNVGVGTKMFFKAHLDGAALSNPQWTIFIKPATSLSVIGTTLDVDTSTQICSFIPDTIGTYKIVFTDGEFTETLTINAALYMGVENGTPPCAGCHNTPDWDYKYDKWMGTGHSTMLERGLNGTLSSHYGESCIKCHTTGYDPDADNNGFDDFPFVFPDTLFPGQYDLMTVAYPNAMARANIQCESCHGPGSSHYGVTTNSKMVKTLSTDNCAWCHDEGTHHAFPEQWDHSGEDATEFDGRGFDGGHARGSFVQSAGTRSGCSPCHSGAGYVEWIYEGRPTDSDGLPAATTNLPDATNISCAVCHDPHDAANIHQLRSVETQLGDGTPVTFDKYGTGVQCMDCHRSRRNAKTYASDVSNQSTHYGAHHGPQADMLLGKNAPDYGIDFPTSPHALAGGNSCNDCHMAGDLADANGNINVVGGHSWNMNDAEGNDFVGACATCHGDIGTSFTDKKYFINGNADLDNNGTAEGLQIEVEGLMEQLSAFLPHDADGNVSISNSNVEGMTLTPAIMRGGYVYIWIEEDRSLGVHNPAFTVSLIKAAMDELGGVTSFEYPKSGIPQAYQLSQNYPNPFNPSTTIEYTIPEQSNVKITIYDALGKEVEVLFNGEQSAGLHRLDWNASSYASGIYFYRMNTGSFAQVKKMLLLK